MLHASWVQDVPGTCCWQLQAALHGPAVVDCMGWGTGAVESCLSRAAAVIWVDPSLISWLKSTLSLLRGALGSVDSKSLRTSPRAHERPCTEL